MYMVNNHITYKDENGEEKSPRLNIGEAVLSDSLFTQYMRKHGMTVRADNTTDDSSGSALFTKKMPLTLQ